MILRRVLCFACVRPATNATSSRMVGSSVICAGQTFLEIGISPYRNGAHNMFFTQGRGFVFGASVGLPYHPLWSCALVCRAADTASLATWFIFGKLINIATHVAFGEKRCRKNLPLDDLNFSHGPTPKYPTVACHIGSNRSCGLPLLPSTKLGNSNTAAGLRFCHTRNGQIIRNRLDGPS